MPRLADLQAERAQLVAEINSVHRAIEHIETTYFHAHPMAKTGEAGKMAAAIRRHVKPEVRESMRARLAAFHVQRDALLRRLDHLDERMPEPEPWYSR